MFEFKNRIDGPVAVIGDVHGQTDKLLAILDQLKQRPDWKQRWIVFIGDLVDRGPDSRGTMDLIIDLIKHYGKITGVAGNHDFAMAASLGLIETPDYSNWADRWMDHYSSEATFESYGVPLGDLEALRNALPDSHAWVLKELPWSVEHSRYLFVHAGLDPHSPFDMQVKILRQKDFSLNRPVWLCEKSLANGNVPDDCPITVVSGHVQMPKVTFHKKQILCDTTGGREGDLSCVLLPENEVISSGRSRTRSAARVPEMMETSSHQPAEKPGWWKFW